MKLIVQLDDGETFETTAKSSDSLAAVKLAVQEKTQVPPHRQKLFFGGNELEDAPTLAHSLWEALRKAAGSDSDGRLDLSLVKAMCSPASTPKGASPGRLSPVRSGLNLAAMVDTKAGMESEANTRTTLESVAAKLDKDASSRISPSRRMATQRLKDQYNSSSELNFPQMFEKSIDLNDDSLKSTELGQVRRTSSGTEFTGYHEDMLTEGV